MAGNKSANTRSEIDRKLFDRIAGQYARKDLLPAQRIARQHRLRQTIASVNFPIGKVLEIGCGAGFAADYLSGMYEEYVGIDYSSELIDFAKNCNERPNACFLVADINDFDTDERFDLVFMIGVLHHLEDPVNSMVRIGRLLKPSGWIIANEPQSGNPLITIARAIRKRVDPTYSPDQDEYSRGQLLEIFRQVGLTQLSTIPQGIFSTPIAEIAMPLQTLITPLSYAACAVDGFLENYIRRLLYPVAWNLIAVGRKP